MVRGVALCCIVGPRSFSALMRVEAHSLYRRPPASMVANGPPAGISPVEFPIADVEKTFRDIVTSKGLVLDVPRALESAKALRHRCASQALPVAPHPITKELMGLLRRPDGQPLTWEDSVTGARQRWPAHLLAVRALITFVLQRRVASYRRESRGSLIPIPAIAQALAQEHAAARAGQRTLTASLTPPAAVPAGAQSGPHADRGHAAPPAPEATAPAELGQPEPRAPGTPASPVPAHGAGQANPGAHSPQQDWPAPDLNLPAGWGAATDPTSGYPYFFNVELGTSQWERPQPAVRGGDPPWARSRTPRPRRVSRWDVPGTASATVEPAMVQPVPPPAEIHNPSVHTPAMPAATIGTPSIFAIGATATVPMLQGGVAAESPAAAPFWNIDAHGGQGQRSGVGGPNFTDQSVVAGGPSAGAPQRAQAKPQPRRIVGWTAADFADLRAQHPPMDPALLLQDMARLVQQPASPPGTPIVKYVPPEAATPRMAKWFWWMALARIGIFVREMYIHTPFAPAVNAAAGIGTSGQEVVRSSIGTIIWMKKDKRISCPNGTPELFQRLAWGFPAFNPVADLANFHRGVCLSRSPMHWRSSEMLLLLLSLPSSASLPFSIACGGSQILGFRFVALDAVGLPSAREAGLSTSSAGFCPGRR